MALFVYHDLVGYSTISRGLFTFSKQGFDLESSPVDSAECRRSRRGSAVSQLAGPPSAWNKCCISAWITSSSTSSYYLFCKHTGARGVGLESKQTW